MCPACLAVAALVGAVFRPWRARRRAHAAAEAAAWRPEAS